MKKRLLTLILAVLIIFTLAFSVSAAGFASEVTADAVLLVDVSNGRTLYSKDASAKVYPAGTTKLMTALVALENTADLDALITIGEAELEGIDIESDLTIVPALTPGETLTMRQLLSGLLIASGNDAASAVAYHTAGSIDTFVDMMNSKAYSLGMTGTHFSNPHGMAAEDHYTTAEDMAILASAILKQPALMDILGTKTTTIPETNLNPERVLTSVNLLLTGSEEQVYAPATGMLGGYTSTAGECLIASAELDGKELICLIFGEELDRWTLAKQLLDYGFNCYVTYSGQEVLSKVPLVSDIEKMQVTANFTGVSFVLPDTFDLSNITVRLTPPVNGKEGEGLADYYAYDGTHLASVPVTYEKIHVPFGDKLTNESRNPGLVIGLIAAAIVIIAVIAFIVIKILKNKSEETNAAFEDDAADNIEADTDSAPVKEPKYAKPAPSSDFKIKFRRYFFTWLFFGIVVIIVLMIILLLTKCGA